MSHQPFTSFLENVLSHGEAQYSSQLGLAQAASFRYMLVRCPLIKRETCRNTKTVDSLESNKVVMLPEAQSNQKSLDCY